MERKWWNNLSTDDQMWIMMKYGFSDNFNPNRVTQEEVIKLYNLENSEILQLSINKTNTKLISTNKTSCYVMGIGVTDYTIHRDANDIKQMYFDKSGFFRSFNIVDFHNYHVFQARIKSIAGDIKYKDIITYKGNQYKVNEAYIGLPNKCKVIYNPSGCRSIDYLTFEGDDMKSITEYLKYVLNVTKL